MRVLVDTSALLALSRARDQYHGQAVRIATRHIESGGGFLGTTAILGELYSHLLYLRGGAKAREILRRLLDDPVHDWQPVTPDLVRRAATEWLDRYTDQSFSLVDAVSFEVMRRERIGRAFAFDRHFEVAGFELLG